MMYPTNCPSCGVDLQGAPIPEQFRYMYGGRTHYNRAIALVDRDRDRATHWLCPDCGHQWEREAQSK